MIASYRDSEGMLSGDGTSDESETDEDCEGEENSEDGDVFSRWNCQRGCDGGGQNCRIWVEHNMCLVNRLSEGLRTFNYHEQYQREKSDLPVFV
jgi:hypothetical protein